MNLSTPYTGDLFVDVMLLCDCFYSDIASLLVTFLCNSGMPVCTGQHTLSTWDTNGTWSVVYVNIGATTFNSTDLRNLGIQDPLFSVISLLDIPPPALMNVTLTPSVVNITTEPAEISISMLFASVDSQLASMEVFSIFN